MMDTIAFRKVDQKDQRILEGMLYAALFIPQGEPIPPASVVRKPELSKYYLHWGRTGDMGIIAIVGEIPIAACWSRIHPENDPGYGFVDEYTPELTIAVKDGWRNRGLGKGLLSRLCDDNRSAGFKSMSLSVDKRNPAQNLYNRLGFKIVAENGTAYTMLKSLQPVKIS
ncbi:GNAT family N-acetyltransferase [Fulvivirgaceae bacterium BMA12]|uniref:GNAT family N-acetyltransferase n=1 Tax=Agaribacillus aureus TaxID=3051825 RepID=A0ABT8L058_9BACT|nr:GNAT family N-acetyltransferase [Fulvivirgaceae bacterium BMA12]